MRRALAVFALCALVGCSKDKPTGPGQPDPGPAETALTPDLAKALIPEAAGVPADFMKALTSGPPAGPPPNGYSLTYAVLDYPPPAEPIKDAELNYLTDGPVSPAAIINPMRKSEPKGYASLIQSEYVTGCTCTVDGDVATGVVNFKAENAYAGRAEYTARKKDGKWRVEEFRMPNLKIKVTLGADGKWVKG